MHSASGRRSHSTTENLREPQSPGTPARPGSPQDTNTRAVVVGTALDSWNSGMTVKAATFYLVLYVGRRKTSDTNLRVTDMHEVVMRSDS